MMSSGPPTDTPRPGTVSVIVTVLNDPRVTRTLESLLSQTRPPLEILVDDGGHGDLVARIAEEFARKDARVRHVSAPGTIPESRNAAIPLARGEFLAFLDADEVAPTRWLEALLAPFADARVGFSGGPTPAIPDTLRTIGARFYDGYLRRFYDVVARHHPSALPMGNSAWRARVFREVGLLDTTLYPRAASEDQDIALRTLGAGYAGAYVPEAFVEHDFSGLSTRSLLHKQRIYAEGGFVVWRRSRATYEATPGRVLPYLVLPVLIVVGLVLLPFPVTLLTGEILTSLGAIGLGLLALGLTVQGILLDRQYAGLRYNVLEIPRRWATLLGALSGWFHYGWSGRRNPGPHPRSGPPENLKE